jgi:hypothetical protein
MRAFILIVIWLLTLQAQAYPDFIGYGYKTCITCHYNSQGNGPLTDYGRAIFSQEVAARNFWTPKAKTDEEIAEKDSGFIPGTQLPWWVRPNIKYRGLWFQTNPRGTNSVSKTIQMQRDFNIVFAFDENSRKVLVLNYGLLPEPKDFYGNGEQVSAVSREAYFRFYIGEKFLVATGLMDKAYGLRTSDHTSFARDPIGIGEDDQVHGILMHWLDENWDSSLHVYAGNLNSPSETRKAGAALQYEYSLAEKDRLGASFLTEKNNSVDSKRFAVHNRWGFPKSPSSLLVELGLKQDQSTGEKATLGSYGMIQSVVNLIRGYNFLTTIERTQAESKFSSPEIQRWTFGFLMFPLQRTEVRLTAVGYKNFSPEAVSVDQWQLQGQLHVSW